jgi:hypothetical protein
VQRGSQGRVGVVLQKQAEGHQVQPDGLDLLRQVTTAGMLRRVGVYDYLMERHARG